MELPIQYTPTSSPCQKRCSIFPYPASLFLYSKYHHYFLILILTQLPSRTPFHSPSIPLPTPLSLSHLTTSQPPSIPFHPPSPLHSHLTPPTHTILPISHFPPYLTPPTHLPTKPTPCPKIPPLQPHSYPFHSLPYPFYPPYPPHTPSTIYLTSLLPYFPLHFPPTPPHHPSDPIHKKNPTTTPPPLLHPTQNLTHIPPSLLSPPTHYHNHPPKNNPSQPADEPRARRNNLGYYNLPSILPYF